MPHIQLPDGRTVPATKVDFEAENEPWAEYEVSDGTTLKVKVVAEDLLRVDPEDHGQGDEPLYHLASDTKVRTIGVPEDLIADPDVDDDEFESGVA